MSRLWERVTGECMGDLKVIYVPERPEADRSESLMREEEL
jgi:hypothetical protein